MLESAREWTEDVIHGHRATVRLLCAGGALAAVLLAVVGLPRTEFGDMLGLTSVQGRMRAAGSAVYWSAHALIQDEEVQRPQVIYGVIDRIEQRGDTVLVDVPLGEKWIKATYQLADLQITDRQAAQRYLDALPTRNTRLEVFYGTHAVAYVQSEPLNIGLIAAGAAAVKPKPPSNKVSRAFAAYYWGLVKGKS